MGIRKQLSNRASSRFSMHKKSSAFTLIELLVVVAIIGVLATVVTAILISSGKGKGQDAVVQANLSTIKGQAELFASDNNNSFLPAGGSALGITSPCPYSGPATNMFAADPIIKAAMAEAVKNGTGSACYNSSSAWAVAVALKSGDGTGGSKPDSWCIDSGGAGKFYAWSGGENILSSINISSCK